MRETDSDLSKQVQNILEGNVCYGKKINGWLGSGSRVGDEILKYVMGDMKLLKR